MKFFVGGSRYPFAKFEFFVVVRYVVRTGLVKMNYMYRIVFVCALLFVGFGSVASPCDNSLTGSENGLPTDSSARLEAYRAILADNGQLTDEQIRDMENLLTTVIKTQVRVNRCRTLIFDKACMELRHFDRQY